MTSVAMHQAVFVVPQLMAGTVGDVRRADERQEVIAWWAAGCIVLIEVPIVVTPGIRAADESLIGAPLRLHRRFVVFRECAVELCDDIRRAASDLRSFGVKVG